VSLANLDTDDYGAIGQHLREIADGAVEQWKAVRGATKGNGHGNGNGNGKRSRGK
jgi:hypothetical protein